DGKSLVSSNLALAFANAGSRRLLIDGDVRRGALHATFDVSPTPGLVEHLHGLAGVETILHATSTPNLFVIARGARRNRAPELLISDVMRRLIISMKEQFDVIIIDSPPLVAGMDAYALGAAAGSMLLVLRPAVTDRKLADAKLSQSHGGDSQKNTMMAAAIRQRLRDGDFQVGDRIVVTVVANEPHTDTLIVRSGRAVELPARLGEISIPLAGILRSELQERMSVEILKYVKAAQIVVTPLVRVGILGEVARPGYFAFASDVPVTDAIMGAGGPSVNADLDRSVVKRGNREYRSPKETRDA